MLVILDTNVLYGDYRLRGASLTALCQVLDPLDLRLVVPEVVVMETVNQVRERLERAAATINDEIRYVRRAAGVALAEPVAEDRVAACRDEYDAFLRERLRSAGAEIPPIPDVSHRRVVRRDLSRRKPFEPSGKGYRDALIWETVLTLAGASGPRGADQRGIALVTANTRDFADGRRDLHPDLVADLEDEHLPGERVILHRSLPDFLEAEVIERLDVPLDLLADRAAEDEVPELRESLAEAIVEDLPEEELRSRWIGRNREIRDLEVTDVTDVELEGIEEERQLPSGGHLVRLVARAATELAGTAFEDDLPHLDRAVHVRGRERWPRERLAALWWRERLRVRLWAVAEAETGRLTARDVVWIGRD